MSDFFNSNFFEGEMEENDDNDPMSILAIDDSLHPLEKIKKYIHSNIMLHRLYLVRTLSDSARQIGFTETKTHLIPVLRELLTDYDPAMRQAMVEQIPEFCKYFLELSDEEAYAQIIQNFVPMVSELTTDLNQQVRTSATEVLIQVALAIRPEDVELFILGHVKSLANDNTEEEHRLQATYLIAGICRVLTRDIFLNFLIPLVQRLASDPAFRVRKTVAVNLGTIAAAVDDPEIVLASVFPIFQELSQDDIWGVRKACVENIVAVGQHLHPSERYNLLIKIFEKLASDQSRWVKGAAFQILGPFVAMFQGFEITTQLLQYFNLTASEMAQDADIMLYCAFNFPAILYTVGGDRWGEISNTYFSLVKEKDLKVRRTLAFSLHEVAQILGTQITERELLPVFDKFRQDIDEVKVGVITHLSKFLAMLSADTRTDYLKLVVNIQADKNWRFRELISKQIGALSKLFDQKEVSQYIAPLAVHLCQDDVYVVRQSASKQIGELLGVLDHEESKSMKTELERQITSMASHATFQRRQLFLHICESLMHQVPPSYFESKILPLLVVLSKDRVPNVRIGAVHVLHQLLQHEFFRENSTVKNVLEQMKTDGDKDVSFFAHEEPSPPVNLLEDIPQSSVPFMDSMDIELPHVEKEEEKNEEVGKEEKKEEVGREEKGNEDVSIPAEIPDVPNKAEEPLEIQDVTPNFQESANGNSEMETTPEVPITSEGDYENSL